MRVMRATSVEEAIEMAVDLKAQGEYDWFRGQVQDWVPAPSLFRRLQAGTVTTEASLADLAHFLQWVSTIPELSYLASEDSVDATCAILQHHGVPTNYIDFTTEPSVAGFFSADTSEPPPPGTESVIFCLKIDDLVEFYDTHRDVWPEAKVAVVSIDVSNLWRLQAQRGCFIYTNHDWYNIYDMDRIIFPYTGYPAYPQPAQIYPPHKSQLEMRLDEYFSLKSRRDGTALMKEMFKHMEWIHMADPEIPAAAEVVWQNDELTPWRQSIVEPYARTVGRQMPLQLRTGPGTPPVAKQASVAVASMLRRETGLRTLAIDWSVSGAPARAWGPSLSESCVTLWNGLRMLPLSDEDLAHAIGVLVDLYVAQAIQGNSNRDDCAEAVFDAPLYIDFGIGSSVSSRGYCAANALRESLAPIWREVIAKHTELDVQERMRAVMRTCPIPSRVYEFEKFARVFVRELVPTQVAIGRNLVLFNPAELTHFGLH